MKEDDQVQMLSKSNVQDDTNQASSSGSHDNEQDQVASISSQPNDQASARNQGPILQPTQGPLRWNLFYEKYRVPGAMLFFFYG